LKNTYIVLRELSHFFKPLMSDDLLFYCTQYLVGPTNKSISTKACLNFEVLVSNPPPSGRFPQLSVCKELQLALSEYAYTADMVALSSPGPLETASVQSISVLTVASEGSARFWPSLTHEGNYTEAELNLGDLCNFVVAVRVS